MPENSCLTCIVPPGPRRDMNAPSRAMGINIAANKPRMICRIPKMVRPVLRSREAEAPADGGINCAAGGGVAPVSGCGTGSGGCGWKVSCKMGLQQNLGILAGPRVREKCSESGGGRDAGAAGSVLDDDRLQPHRDLV